MFYSSIRLLLWVYRFSFPEGDTWSVFLDRLSITQFGIICDRIVRQIGQAASAVAPFSTGEATVYVGYLRTLQGGGNSHRLLKLEKQIANCDLLIIDEMSCLTFNRHQSELLLKVIADRSERKSIIVSTNPAFSE